MNGKSEREKLVDRIRGGVLHPDEFGIHELRMINDLMFALKWSHETNGIASEAMRLVSESVNTVREWNRSIP